MSIARYKQDYEDTYAASDGEWVTYADHAASLADAQAEIARLRGALEKCSTALHLAAPFADGCNVEDALTIEIGRAAALEALNK